MTPTKQPAGRVVSDVAASVAQWRLETLERAGYDHELADRIAHSDADLHRAVALLERGCSPQLAAEILL
jgi:hypothetical protein